MIDWTDKHCRYFHRRMTSNALQYTEMIVADAAIHGDRDRLLGNGPRGELEGPVALQLGGSDPLKLAEAAKIGAGYGYDEINLNVGCPSDRVQSGAFGACLMREPDLVADCILAMKNAVDLPVTVKCRIGVDDQDPALVLPGFAQKVWNAGVDGLWVHARKAWLEGLSPKENRTIPPLDYEIVRDLKRGNESYFIGLNGGLENLVKARDALQKREPYLDGVMLGRAAYQTPQILREVDQLFYGSKKEQASLSEIVGLMGDYAEEHILTGGRLHHVTRHMVGLFQGMRGARLWRQTLSIEASKEGAGKEVIEKAFGFVTQGQESRESDS